MGNQETETLPVVEKQQVVHPLIDRTMKNNNTVSEIDLLTYEEILQEAIANSSTEQFPNTDMNHAAVAMSVLFENTENNLCLVVDSFKGDVSNNPKYYNSLTKCLERGVSVQVLTLKPVNPESKGFQVLLDKKSKGFNSIEINQATAKSLDILKAAMPKALDFGEIHNIALCDKNKYRLEFLPSKYMAILSFNAPAYVSKFQTTFTEAFKAGEPKF